MQIRQLKTLLAVADHGAFSAAGAAIGLSHSAVSLHMKALEEGLGAPLFDRATRPPTINSRGLALVERAQRMIELLDEIAGLGSDATLAGALSVGVVPTAMIDLMPPALGALKAQHPAVAIRIRTGPSGELALRVRNGDIDVAVATAPDAPQEGLRVRGIADEPLFVLAPSDAQGANDADLLTTLPFIQFSRETWAAQQIERRILARGLRVRPSMEVDSLEAIEALARNGLGVSIVPQRTGATGFANGLRVEPFCQPQAHRQLVLLERVGNPKSRLADAFLDRLREIAAGAGA